MNNESMNNESREKTMIGFWIYLMTDLTMFAVLFAAFAVLRGSTFGGPDMYEITDLPFVLIETLILLVSSFTCGVGVLLAHNGNKKNALIFLYATFLLGISFLGMELYEFSHLFHEGITPQRSAFLTSYFSLVGTHGLHITAGLLWMAILFIYIMRKGFTDGVLRKFTLLGIFWHFLDVVWIFIFSVVYLMGVTL